MPDLQPILDQLMALNPLWAALAGLVVYILRVKGWLQMPSLGGAGASSDPLVAKLQARVAERYKALASAGQEEEAFYHLYSRLKEDPK